MFNIPFLGFYLNYLLELSFLKSLLNGLLLIYIIFNLQIHL